jgi:HTH-type transcriptional regulator / antitoxin HigA
MKRNAGSPAAMLRSTLAELEWDQRTLARILGRPVQMVNEVVNGKKSITVETAYQLEAAGLGDAFYWMTLQVAHDLRTSKPSSLASVRRRAMKERLRRRKSV